MHLNYSWPPPQRPRSSTWHYTTAPLTQTTCTPVYILSYLLLSSYSRIVIELLVDRQYMASTVICSRGGTFVAVSAVVVDEGGAHFTAETRPSPSDTSEAFRPATAARITRIHDLHPTSRWYPTSHSHSETELAPLPLNDECGGHGAHASLFVFRANVLPVPNRSEGPMSMYVLFSHGIHSHGR